MENNNKTNTNTPFIQVKDLRKDFTIRGDGLFKKQHLTAVDGVSFDINQGETFGLIGESGSGKSTIGKAMLRLIPSTSGEILFENQNIHQYSDNEFRKLRKNYQMIFQDSSYALDPKMFIKDILAEPMQIHKTMAKKEIPNEVKKLLDIVGLPQTAIEKFPHEFSGGERQRLVIAKVLATKPKFIVCDEPVSALDMSVQAKILNLLIDLKKEFGLTYLFIAHGLNVVKYIADQVGVMYLGRILEIGPSDEIFNNPKHPYTKALISGYNEPNPKDKKERIILKGEIPSLIDRPQGCLFHTRCPWVREECKHIVPDYKNFSKTHKYACIMD